MPGPIGYLVRRIINFVDGQGRGEPAYDTEAGQTDGEQVEFERTHRDGRRRRQRRRRPIRRAIGTVVGKNEQQTETAKKTEEEKARSQLLGEPNDPKNAASKKKSWYAVLLAGFALSLDFTMALMSIQALYYSLNGPDHLYGLTFGSYDLTGLIVAPFLGSWADRRKIFKIPMILGIVINICGNIIYAFCFIADAWWMMLLGRLVAGVSTATLGLGSGYIASTTTLQRRQVALVHYRVSQSIARMLGPFVGYFFLGLPDVNQNSSAALRVFNWYTIPGWFAAVLAAIVLLLFWILFIDPTFENEHLVDHEAIRKELAASEGELAKDSETIQKRTTKFRNFVGLWLPLIGMQSLLQYAFYSTLFSLFAGQYHAVDNQGDQWKVFIGVGIGAAVSAALYRRMIRLNSDVFNERILSCFANLLMFVVYMLVIPYHGESDVPPDAIFYAASGLAGASIVLGSSASETVFSKKVTQYGDVTFWGSEVNQGIARLLGIYFMANASGRFAGPLIAGAVLRIATPDGNVFYCPNESTNSDGSITCSGENACAITADNYYTEGCILHGATILYSTFAGIQFVVFIASVLVVRCHWSYDT